MIRAFAPSVILASVIVAAGLVAFDRGAPYWVIYVAMAIGVFSGLPAYERWEKDRKK